MVTWKLPACLTATWKDGEDVDAVEALHLAGDLAGSELHVDCGSSVLRGTCHTKW